MRDGFGRTLIRPGPGEVLGRVLENRGNRFSVEIDSSGGGGGGEEEEQQQQQQQPRATVLCLLPKKFAKLVWLRPGSVVIVDPGGGSGAEGVIVSPVDKDSLKALDRDGLLPLFLKTKSADNQVADEDESGETGSEGDDYHEKVEENPNRRQKGNWETSSEEEDD